MSVVKGAVIEVHTRSCHARLTTRVPDSRAPLLDGLERRVNIGGHTTNILRTCSNIPGVFGEITFAFVPTREIQDDSLRTIAALRQNGAAYGYTHIDNALVCLIADDFVRKQFRNIAPEIDVDYMLLFHKRAYDQLGHPVLIGWEVSDNKIVRYSAQDGDKYCDRGACVFLVDH